MSSKHAEFLRKLADELALEWELTPHAVENVRAVAARHLLEQHER